jgi:hypothetical protein
MQLLTLSLVLRSSTMPTVGRYTNVSTGTLPDAGALSSPGRDEAPPPM